MHVLLDHISSVLVASVLFIALITVVNRNRQNTVELQVGQMVHKQALDFARTVERDLENIRSTDQVQAQLGRPEECIIERDAAGNATRLIFPTLEDPQLGLASGIVHVEYRLVPVDTTTIDVVGAPMQVYRVERRQKIDPVTYVDEGGSGAYITRFTVRMVEEGATGGGGGLVEACPDALDRTHIELQAAVPTVQNTGSDQKSTNNLNIVRYGNTVYSHNR